VKCSNLKDAVTRRSVERVKKGKGRKEIYEEKKEMDRKTGITNNE
jgi:stalled ribosome alternative rescue factor ArfA